MNGIKRHIENEERNDFLFYKFGKNNLIGPSKKIYSICEINKRIRVWEIDFLGFTKYGNRKKTKRTFKKMINCQ